MDQPWDVGTVPKCMVEEILGRRRVEHRLTDERTPIKNDVEEAFRHRFIEGCPPYISSLELLVSRIL